MPAKGGVKEVSSPCPSVMTDSQYAYLTEAFLIAKTGYRSNPKTNPLILNDNREHWNYAAKKQSSKNMSKCDHTTIMLNSAKGAATVLVNLRGNLPRLA